MKFQLLLFCFLFAGFQSGNAQSLIPRKGLEKSLMPEPIHPGENTRPSTISVPPNTNIPIAFRDDVEVQIGKTRFDLQTAGSINRRIYTSGDEVSAIFHFGNDDMNGFPERGAGYNHFDGNAWSTIPTTSVEGLLRGGYPSFTVLKDGTEVIVSHSQRADGSGWDVFTYRKAPGTDTWDRSIVPATESAAGMVWAKITSGGTDGQSLHMIAVTLSERFGGADYRGIDQHLLYYRSQDAGKSWDITDMVLPETDSTLYFTHGSEEYLIDAQEETVAIGLFTSWGDAAVFKSEDNGDSWERTVVIDFPLDGYDQMGYSADDIPDDPDAPDSLSMLTTDGSASLVIDDNGIVHTTFGEMYVNGDAAGDLFYFPGMDGLGYWNESMGPNNHETIAFVQDFDGDSIITFEQNNLALYFMSLTSMPSIGVDNDGNIYITYSAYHELNIDAEEQHYRQTYLLESKDVGTTWSAPYPTVNEETISPDFADFIDFIEAVYPCLPRRIGDKVQMIYQQDFEPGLSQSGDMDDPGDNQINYVVIDKANIGLTSTKEIDLPETMIRISPNPTSDVLNIDYVLNQTSDIRVSFFDLLGQKVLDYSFGKKTAGNHRETLNPEGLKTGVYFVRIQADKKAVTRKVIFE